MRTAIVTGASGFIGSRLVQQLLKRGWQVHVLGRAEGTTSYEDRIKATLFDIDFTLDFGIGWRESRVAGNVEKKCIASTPMLRNWLRQAQP